jgi:hypothetical protein
MVKFTKRKIVLRIGIDAKKEGARCQETKRSCPLHSGTTSDEAFARL